MVGISTDEKLFLEQAGSLHASFPLLFCFTVLGVNVSESKKCFDKKRAKVTWKACPLANSQGRCLPSISIALPSIAKSGKEPKPYWNLILFWNYVQFGIFLSWKSLSCSSSPLTVICRVEDLGWISVFCAYKAAGASMSGLECVVSTHWMWKTPSASYRLWFLFVLSQCDFTEVQKLCQCETQTKSMLFQDNCTTRENSFYSTHPLPRLNFSGSLSFSDIQ